MSRGVRDLRDLICVSRLTVRESDEEDFVSDDNHGNLCRENSLPSEGDMTNSKLDSPTDVTTGNRVLSPDSGFVTNGSPSISSVGLVCSVENLSQEGNFFLTSTKKDKEEPLQSGTARFHSQKKKKRKKNNQQRLPLEPAKHELPKPPPLPPLQGAGCPSENSLLELGPESTTVIKSNGNKQSRINFDDMMIYLDAIIVANWLTRANEALQHLITFCNKGDNYIQFAHFWLSEFPDLQKKDIFRMEYDILLDELTLAYAVGKEKGNVVRRDILDLCGAIFKEYPLKLLSVKGPNIFLNHLDILTSEKQEQYKLLLSDVRCSTSNRQFAQWLLAMRSFALVNIWSSVINFYRNLTGDCHSNPVHDLWSSKEKIHIRRMLQAIRLGFIDVIHFLIANGHVDPSLTDSHGRTFIFSAVMHNQVDAVKFFAKKVQQQIDINLASDTGNTPLHAACNNGNFTIVEILCSCDNINVNCQNSQCENVAPLHLGVMHGHSKIVECLLKHGADPTLKTGSTTVYDLARDFEHHDMKQILHCE